MEIHSELFDTNYEMEDVRLIPNMKQNYKYLNSGLASGQLVDIICGSDEKVIFVWKKSDVMSDLYDKWCKHEL